MANNLSVNLGVRYDADWGATNPPWVTDTVILIDNGRESGDFGYKTGMRDLNNVAPRVGFAYNVGGKNDLVIRGGSGLYYNTPVSNVDLQPAVLQPVGRRGVPAERADFMEDPTRGVTAEQTISPARVPAPAQAATHHRRRLSRIPTAGRARSASRSSSAR